MHLFALIPLVALLIASRPRLRDAAVSLGVIAVAVAPLVWLASRETVQVSWMTPLPPDAAWTLATDLAGGTLAAWTLYPLVVVLLGVRLRERAYRPAMVVAAALAGPVVLLAASYLVRPVYVERCVLASMPLLALAVGLLVGGSRIVAALLVVVGLFAAERPLPEVTAALARCPRIWVAGYTGQAANWNPVPGTAGAALSALRSGAVASPPVAFGEFSVAMWTPVRVPVASP